MHQPDVINIPAFKRKRNLLRREKLAEQESGVIKIKVAKEPRKKISRSRIKRSISRSPRKFSPPLMEEIAIQELLPSQELFDEVDYENINARKHRAVQEMKQCGTCEGYFDQIEVAVVKLTSPLRQGDLIIFEKQDGLFQQEISSMQIDRKDVKLATTGSDIGLKVYMKPKVGTPVYKVI